MSDNHEVGYKKPPKHSRFKRGQSGNPKGRPIGTRNLKTDLQEELQEMIRIREGSRERRISKRRALFKSQLAKGIKGDSRAANLILSLAFKVMEGETLDPVNVTLPADDAKILEEFTQRVLADRYDKGHPSDGPVDSTAPEKAEEKGIVKRMR